MVDWRARAAKGSLMAAAASRRRDPLASGASPERDLRSLDGTRSAAERVSVKLIDRFYHDRAATLRLRRAGAESHDRLWHDHPACVRKDPIAG
jgi:hypothetical protein